MSLTEHVLLVILMVENLALLISGFTSFEHNEH